jgi:two-component system response regulator CssR
VIDVQSIFAVEPEYDTRHTISRYLLAEGFQVQAFGTAKEAADHLIRGYPDMFILEVAPLRKDCFDFFQEIRKEKNVPVIFIIPQENKSLGVMSLELGGDDYLFKPLDVRELVARVRSVFRRYLTPFLPPVLEVGNLKLYPEGRRVTLDDREIMLTPKEYELLLMLLQQPQKVFSRQELLDLVWGSDYIGTARNVDDLIKRLRKKLKSGDSRNDIKTVWGRGYRFNI